MIKRLKWIQRHSFLFILISCFLSAGLSFSSVLAQDYDYNLLIEKVNKSYTYSVKDKAGSLLNTSAYNAYFKVSLDEKTGKATINNGTFKAGSGIPKNPKIPSISINSPNTVLLNFLTIQDLSLKAQILETVKSKILKAGTFEVNQLKPQKSSFAEGNYLIRDSLIIKKSDFVTLGKDTVFSCGDINNLGTLLSNETLTIDVQPNANPTQIGSVQTKQKLILQGPLSVLQNWYYHPDTFISHQKDGLILPKDEKAEFFQPTSLTLNHDKIRAKYRQLKNSFENGQFKKLQNLKIDTGMGMGADWFTDSVLHQYLQLTNLEVTQSKITDNHLSKLTNLESLSLNKCNGINGDCFKDLTELKTLKLSVFTSNPSINGAAINSQKNLVLPQSITNLSMTGIIFQEDTFNGLTNLEKLMIKSPPKTPLGMAHAEALFNTVSILKILEYLSVLKELNLQYCNIDAETEKKIRAKYPKLNLTTNN